MVITYKTNAVSSNSGRYSIFFVIIKNVVIIRLYVAIFVAIFVAVWLSQYLLWKRKIKQMNTLVNKDH